MKNRSMWMLVLLAMINMSAAPAQEAKATMDKAQVLFRKPLNDAWDLAVVRGPDQPADPLESLERAEDVERLEAAYELRVQIISKDGRQSLTLVSWLKSVLKADAPDVILAPHGVDVGRFPSKLPREYAVLDMAHAPLEVTDKTVRQGQVVIATRVNGVLEIIRWSRGELRRTYPTGWHGFSTPVSGDPRSARLSYADGRWVVDVSSGSDARMKHTRLQQIDPERWEFEVAKAREERSDQ